MQRGVWSDERGVACREGCGLMRGVWHAERVWSDERGVACREGVV